MIHLLARDWAARNTVVSDVSSGNSVGQKLNAVTT